MYKGFRHGKHHQMLASQQFLINHIILLTNHFQFHSHLKEDEIQNTMKKIRLQQTMNETGYYTIWKKENQNH
jgi:hypothetical protein